MHPHLNIAVKAARSAAKVLIDAILHSNLGNEYKDLGKSSDLIDKIVKSAENTIINNILRAYPKHNIYTTNIKEINGSEITWMIDSLNGRLNFIYGIPFFAISIAILNDNFLEHGLIYNPILDELFVATKGNGAKLNNRKIRVAMNKKSFDPLIAAIEPNFNKNIDKAQKDQINLVNRDLGSEALHLAFVAAGRLDGYYEQDVNPLKIAAGILLVKESGGYVNDIDLLSLLSNSSINNSSIIAGNPKIYSKLIN